MLIRAANASDRDRVAEIGRLAFAPLRRVYRPLESPPAQVAGDLSAAVVMQRLVAESDGTIVGTVRYRQVDDRLHLIGLGVHPDHQRLSPQWAATASHGSR